MSVRLPIRFAAGLPLVALLAGALLFAPAPTHAQSGPAASTGSAPGAGGAPGVASPGAAAGGSAGSAPAAAPRTISGAQSTAPKVPPGKGGAFGVGRQLVVDGKFAEAIPQLQGALEKDPKDNIAKAWLGYAFLQVEKYEDSRKVLQEVVDSDPEETDSVNNLGSALLLKGDLDAAVQTFLRAIELRKKKNENYATEAYNLGNAYYRKQQLDDALKALRDSETQNAENPQLLNNLGVVLEREFAVKPQEYPIQQAIGYYQRAVARAPETAIFQRNLGLAARTLPELAALARASLEKATALNAADYDSHVALAEEYEKADNLDAAVAEYGKGIELKPMDPLPLYNRGLIFARQAKYEQAIPDLKKAVDLGSKETRAFAALGWLFLKQNKLQDAVTWYLKAIEADPNDSLSRTNLGIAYDLLGDPVKALIAWKEAIKLNPKDAATLTRIAITYLKNSAYPQASEAYEKLLELTPKDASVLTNLGLSYEKQGKIDEAMDAYRRAIAINPRLPHPHNNLGACYERKGQKGMARTYYQRAHDLDPKFKEAERNLERIKAEK
jgi:protein O-GlcNAc transferase